VQNNNQLTDNILMKKHFFIIALGAIFGLSITYFILLGDVDSTSLTSIQKIVGVLVGVSSAYLISIVALQLDKLLPWHKHEGNRLLLGIIVHYSIAFFWSVLLLYLCCLLLPESFSFELIYNQYLIKFGIILFILILVFEIIYFALYSYYSYTTFQIATVRQERKQIELQLKALKSQLSPHFLFNSLNTISSLIFKDKMKAERFIRRLAEMYDYILHSYQVKLTSLKDELAFVNSYKYLLQTRFGEKFQCLIDIDDTLLSSKIPPLTIQMLLENAVKHNVLEENNPLTIRISNEKEYIIVSNNITKKPKHITSFKIGLKNINSRYLLLHTEGIMITNGGKFEVKIPIISE
tara:strand:- start:95591 stop:96640 length:1050 start_codon:yes stop_codon:yes gene_type:complete